MESPLGGKDLFIAILIIFWHILCIHEASHISFFLSVQCVWSLQRARETVSSLSFLSGC